MRQQRKDLHLFALGNALVDIHLHVDETFLEQLQIRKGTMQLVHHQEQQRFLQQCAQQIIHSSSGGSAANTIITFARLGGKAGYGTLLGNDELAKIIQKEFEEFGIALFAEIHQQIPTGSCLVFITPDAERTMQTSLAANVYFSPEHISEEAVARAEWLFIEGYKFSERLGAEAIDRSIFYSLRNKTQVAISLSDQFIVENFYSELTKAVKSATLIFCNEQEALAFTQRDTVEGAFRELKKRVRYVVVTRGAQGSWISWAGQEYRIPAYPATAIDSTGAGDTYAAAFFYGVIHRLSPELAGHVASFAGARVVEQLGARLSNERIAEVKAFLQLKQKEGCQI